MGVVRRDVVSWPVEAIHAHAFVRAWVVCSPGLCSAACTWDACICACVVVGVWIACACMPVDVFVCVCVSLWVGACVLEFTFACEYGCCCG